MRQRHVAFFLVMLMLIAPAIGLTENTLEHQQVQTQIQKIIENTIQNDQNKPQIEQNIENAVALAT